LPGDYLLYNLAQIIGKLMNKQSLMDFFQENSDMSLKTVTNITDHFEERKFLKNEFFLKEGKISDLLYLAEGLMRAYTFDLKGNEVTTNFFTSNRQVYDHASFFLQTGSGEYIQAITDCLAYSITFEKMNSLFHSIPEFREYGRRMLVKELVSHKKRTLAMINKSAEQRYEDLIKGNKEIFQFVQLRHIASYLGVTNSSLSRIRREFSKR
jgi:CRP-like cAMP-binding protein